MDAFRRKFLGTGILGAITGLFAGSSPKLLIGGESKPRNLDDLKFFVDPLEYTFDLADLRLINPAQVETVIPKEVAHFHLTRATLTIAAHKDFPIHGSRAIAFIRERIERSKLQHIWSQRDAARRERREAELARYSQDWGKLLANPPDYWVVAGWTRDTIAEGDTCAQRPLDTRKT